MKKIFVSILLMMTLLQHAVPIIQAQEPPEPYIVTQDINYETIPIEECLTLLQGAQNQGDESLSVELNLSEVEEQLNAIQLQYDEINDNIRRLESGEGESIDWANTQLMIVIEGVYEELQAADPEFLYLSEEEQLAIVSNHELVIEWQQYIQSIQDILNQLIADRNVLEQNYANLNYAYNELQYEIENTEQSRAVKNECQLYPYSAEYLSVDQVLLNSQTSLNDYLVQIDTYLQKLVAKAYRKVSFEDIYQLFTKYLDITMLEEITSQKPIVVLDALAYESYTYAKELSLIDIETLSQYAQRAFFKNNDQDAYVGTYQEIIQLKEKQFEYFYQINAEAFEIIKQELANYLNNNNFTDAEAIELVRSIHQRYQVKLVYFDDQSMQWHANAGVQSGYYQDYLSKELTPEASSDAISVTDNELSISESLEQSYNTDETNIDESEPNSHLESLKNQLSDVRNNTNVKELPKPDLKQAKNKSDESTSSQTGKKNIELPSTGEKRPLTILAIIILLFGVLLILISQRVKQRKKHEAEKLDLD